MAYLKFNGIEPVVFGLRECTPEINAEMKLRLSQIKNYDEKDCKVLAEAFPNDEQYVRNFLKKMSKIDIQTLHAYLIGGQKMVETVLKSVERQIDKAMDEKKAEREAEE